ncbi:MAG: helix-turn-helix transcriptional regulator [Betaproteobacteria bacterium]
MTFDPIGLIEQAYEPQPGAQAWLRANAARIAAPIDDTGFGTLCYFIRDFQVDPLDARYYPGPRRRFARQRALKFLTAGMSHLSPEQIQCGVLALQRPGAYSFVETFGGLPDVGDARLDDSIRDSPAVIVPTGERTVAIVAPFTTSPLRLSHDLQLLWQRVAIHLGAACRLSARPLENAAADVDAVLDPGGKVIDAQGEGISRAAREQLREGVRRRDKARTGACRSNPLVALSLWQALIAGRWSLTDRIDTDGRRFVLARRNEPQPQGPAALSRRQQQVLFYASVGWSLKQIAYALGLTSEGSVTWQLRAGLNKLGFTSRAELIRLTTDTAMRALGFLPAASPDALAEAERMVAKLAAAGWSNARIARHRGVSVRTVANQLTSVYRKAGVHDRYELIGWLSSSRLA